MAIFEIPDGRENPALANGMITLISGQQIRLVPRAQPAGTAEAEPTDAPETETKAEAAPHAPTANNRLRLDTMGRWFSLGRRNPAAAEADPTPADDEKAEEKAVFLAHLFFFIAHRDEIKADSRMFLAPVPIQSGLAYTGTGGFRRPTLGVYLEWWESCIGAAVVDKDGQVSFIVRLAGSPLSGGNHCTVVGQDGRSHDYSSTCFSNLWHTFMKINTRYDECKEQGEAWSMRRVYERLCQQPNSTYTPHSALALAYRMEVAALTQRLKRAVGQNRKLADDLFQARRILHRNELAEMCVAYRTLVASVRTELEALHARKGYLKRSFKDDLLSQAGYQAAISEIDRRKASLESEVDHFGEERLAAIFPDTPCSMTSIERSMRKDKDLH